PGHGDASDVVAGQDGGELFRVVPLVQLGAADQRHLPTDEVPVEGAVGVGGAVGGNEQVAPVEPGGVHRGQLDLHRPLPQLAGNLPGGGGGALRRALDRPALAAGTAAGQGGGLGRSGRLGGQHGGVVVGGGLPFLEGDGPGGAGRQAVPKPVAVVLP